MQSLRMVNYLRRLSRRLLHVLCGARRDLL